MTGPARLRPLLLTLLVMATRSGAEAPAPLPAAEPHGFSARADKGEVRLGELFGYEIEIQHAPDERYDLPGALDLKPFEATGAACRREAGKSAGEVVTRCSMRLSLFETGEHDIPDLTLVAHTPAGERLLKVPGARVTGVGMLDPGATAQDLQLRDIAPPVPILVPSYRLAAWAAGVLGGAALLALGAWLWHRRRRAEDGTGAPPLAPHERFQRLLDGLESEALPRQGRGRELFFRLSEMVREYVGAILGFNALDLTTEEILGELAQRAPLRFDRDAFAQFCRHSDLVKFARHEPSEAECAWALAFARTLLEQTRPISQPQPQPEPAPAPSASPPSDPQAAARVT
jgi:hypothetical protein